MARLGARGRAPEGTPFELDSTLAGGGERAEFERQAAAAFDVGREANQTSDNFVLAAVLLASVLFFAGLAGTLDSRAPQVILLTLAVVLLVSGTIVVVLLPQNVF